MAERFDNFKGRPEVGDIFETARRNGTVVKVLRTNFIYQARYMGRDLVTITAPISELRGAVVLRGSTVDANAEVAE